MSGTCNKCKSYLREIVNEVKPHAVAIDATNEKFWCAEVRDELNAAAPVLLVVSSEKTEYMGEKMNVKSYLGNLAVNAFEDRSVSLPNYPQIKNDMRLVRKVRGGFDNAVDGAGNHGDTFDAFKLSLHALMSDTGPVDADATRYIIHRGHVMPTPDTWGGPARALLFWWLLSSMSREWWSQFLERYGQPF